MIHFDSEKVEFLISRSRTNKNIYTDQRKGHSFAFTQLLWHKCVASCITDCALKLGVLVRSVGKALGQRRFRSRLQSAPFRDSEQLQVSAPAFFSKTVLFIFKSLSTNRVRLNSRKYSTKSVFPNNRHSATKHP